jgi:hypothetical protein
VTVCNVDAHSFGPGLTPQQDEDATVDRDENAEEQEQQSLRPRVVDKRRVGRSPDAEPRPEAPAPPPQSAAEPPPPPPASTPLEPLPPSPQGEPGGAPGAGGEPVWTPEQEAEAQQLAREFAQTPAQHWIVNLAVTIANVGAAKLEVGSYDEASLAIDALAALVETSGKRLGEAESPLRQTLAQLQMAYAQRAPGAGPTQ